MNRSSARRPCAGRPGVERRTAWSRFGFDAAALSRPTAPVREILNLLGIILPVFLLIGVGVALRRLRWLTPEADPSLLRISVNLLFPCLIFQAVVGNAALREPGNLVWPALLGFGSMGLGWLAGWWTARAIGLERGRGLRTFAFTVGFYNYGYMAIPLVKAQFGPGTLGVLFVFNTGIEMAIWTVGILLLAGGSLRQDWRKIFNAPAVSLVLAVALNALQATPPAPVRATVDWRAGCAVPLGLVLIGAVREKDHGHAPPPRSAARGLSRGREVAPCIDGVETGDHRAGRHARRGLSDRPRPALRRPAPDRRPDRGRHHAGSAGADPAVDLLRTRVGGAIIAPAAPPPGPNPDGSIRVSPKAARDRTV